MAVTRRGSGPGRPAPSAEHGERFQAIIEQAALVFSASGFAAGTTREIASRVGLTQPAIYYYMGSKENILVEIVEHVGAEMEDALRSGMASATDSLAQLRAVLSSFTQAILADRAAFAVYWNEFRSLPEEVRDRLRAGERAFVDAVTALVVRAQHEHHFAAGDPPGVVAEAMIGMASWTYRWYRPDGSLTSEQIGDLFARLVGLGGSPPEANQE